MIKVSLWEFVTDRWPRLAAEAYQHVSVVIQCTLIATLIGVLAGVAVYRSPIGSTIATALASTILTIPSFALLGLLIPLVGLGVAPTVTALVLYALLPIIRNTIVGLGGVDSAVTDAARGIGMNRLRVATQMLMGIAAIAAYAKGPGLGTEIFSGLNRAGAANAVNQALAGTLGIVLMALLIDGLYLLVARLTTSRGIRA